MWLKLCIKNTCTSHIRSRASLTRDSSHCLSIVSKLFVSGITSERTRLPSNLLHSPLKECNIYVSADSDQRLILYWAYIPSDSSLLAALIVLLIAERIFRETTSYFVSRYTRLLSTTSLCDTKAEIHSSSHHSTSLPTARPYYRNLNRTIPSDFVGAMPDITKSKYKAEYWSFWTIHLAPILLQRRFPNEKFYRHFCLLVDIIKLCL